MTNTQLVTDVRRALAEHANPDKAEGMRAYMKSEMPYRGVQKPARRKGIGWALRSLAWTDLPTVENYVARNRDRMSTLSAREALKNADKIRRAA